MGKVELPDPVTNGDNPNVQRELTRDSTREFINQSNAVNCIPGKREA